MAVELATAYISLVPSAAGITGKIEKALGGLDKVAADVGDDAGAGFSGKFLDIAKGGLVAGAVALGAALTKGLLDAIDVEAAGQKLNAQLGATGAYAEDLGKISGDLYANAYGESVGQVNEALRSVLQNGLLPEDATNDQIEAMTAKVLDLSTAFDQDLTKSTAAVSQLIRTGLVDNADEALDVMTRGFQQGVDVRGDFLDTLREYSTQFRNLGLDAETATGLMSQGIKAGARDADIVSDAFKEFGVRAIDGSKLTDEGFTAIGLSADQMAADIAAGGPTAAAALDLTLDRLRAMTDPVARAQAAVALFGVQAEDLGDALYSLDPSEASKTLGTVAGAATEMGATLNDTAAARIETFKRKALGGLATFAGDNLLPGLEALGVWAGEVLPPLVDKASDAFDRVTEVLGQVDWAGVLGDIQAGLEPVVDWIAGTAAPALTKFFDEIGTSIGDAVAFVQDNTAAVQEAVGHILNVIEGLWEIFGETILTAVRDAWGFIRATIENVITVIRNIIVLVLAVINGDWGKAWDALQAIVGAVWDQILNVIGLALDELKAIIGLAWDAIAFVAAWAWEGIKAAVGAVWDEIWARISGVIDVIKTGVSAGFELVKLVLLAPINAAKTAVSTVFDGIAALFTDLPGRLVDALGNMAETIAAPFLAMGEAIRDAWNSTIGGKGFSIPDIPGLPGGGQEFSIPKLHTGGIVGGPPGREVLRVLEAGELVLTRDQVARMRENSPVLAGVGAGPMVGTLQVTTVTNANADETVAAINAKLGWAHTARRDR